MTSPPVPIYKEDGADDRIQSALAPIQAFLQAKQQQDNKVQQMMIQRGWLALEEEKNTEEKKARNEKDKQRKDFAAQLSQAITQTQSPEEQQRLLGGLVGQALDAGEAASLGNAFHFIGGQQEAEKARTREARLSEYRNQIGAAQGDPQKLQTILAQASLEFPEHAGAYSQFATSMGNKQRNIDPLSPEGVAAAVNKAKQLKAAGVTNQGRAPTEAEGKNAGAAIRVLEGHTILSELEDKVPGIGQAVDAKVKAASTMARVPVIGQIAEPAAYAAAIKNMTPEEQQYFAALNDVINARLRRESGAAISISEYDRESRPLVPLAGETDPKALSAKQIRRLQAAMIYARQGGAAFDPNALSEAARAIYDSASAKKGPAVLVPEAKQRKNPYR